MGARYPITLVPAGKIARPVNVGLRLRRSPAAPTPQPTVVIEAAVTEAPVGINKGFSPPNPIVGSNVLIIINVTNLGEGDATNVTVTETLPDGFVFVSADPNVGTYDPETGIWSIGDLPAGSGTKILLITATVLPTGSHLNTANLQYQYTQEQQDVSADVEPEPTPAFPAGSDAWYDAPTASVIPFAAYDGAVSDLTDATDFDVDDDGDFEGDASLPASPLASAWWQLTVPPGVTDALLTVDTWLTTGGRLNSAGDGPADYPGDTNLAIYTTAESPPLGPLPTPSTDFSDLILVASSDDDPDPADPSRAYTSKLTDIALDAGKVYWIRVDTWGSPNMYFDGITYRLRLSLSYTP